MFQIKKILFPTDFSTSAERAFTHAAAIASKLDSEIHAFHTNVRQRDQYPALAHLLEDSEDTSDYSPAEQTIDFSNADHDLVIQADATDSSACNAILDYADTHDVDLIVMGSHGRRGPSRLFLGSTAECVIRNANCPVLTLRSDAKEMNTERFDHIIVPVDFSERANEALGYANAFAKIWDARVSLVHTIEEAIIPTVYGVEAMTLTMVEPLFDKSNKELDALAKAFFDASIDVSTKTLVGRPKDAIAAYATENNADLIILASHGLTGFKRFLLGSVAESLNRKVSCAVMTVKSFGKSLFSVPEPGKEAVA